MWPLVAALLLGSAGYGSSQILFNQMKYVEYTRCNKTVVIPCRAINVEAEKISELFISWKYKGNVILTFDGLLNMTTKFNNFTSAKIDVSKLLKGDASLEMDMSDALLGNYTCEITELSREGQTTVELKHRTDSWFSPNEIMLIVVFPILSVIFFWGQLCVVRLKYKSRLPTNQFILVLIPGILLTIFAIVGSSIFIPGDYSRKKSGLSLLVTPSGMLIVAQCRLLRAVCMPVHGPLLISGLGIITLAESLGLIYMTFFDLIDYLRPDEKQEDKSSE
ncbi:leukocyte surface antigen CD47-like isoform X3 [Lepus europaeus]|uniref:leukocyte surface antigen CD47-like isoform X3 n=1 Tax=Lepus europaeus TaxID=9983 RepID=UPI002B46E87E|nr:leukocyte surface antigen CD47-like isoform X3 [Lepus europaeus]